MQSKLKEAGIPTAIYYVKPLHLLDAYSDLCYKKGDFPISEQASERIFAIPGMGDLFVDGVLNRDHTLTMGIVILYTVLVYTLNFMVDLLYTLIDPRIQLS